MIILLLGVKLFNNIGFGHTHRSCNFILYNTIVCSNQLGYIKWDKDYNFHYDWVIDIKNKTVDFKNDTHIIPKEKDIKEEESNCSIN
jgi:hypothetical protein